MVMCFIETNRQHTDTVPPGSSGTSEKCQQASVHVARAVVVI